MTETFVYESYYIAFCHILSLFLLVSINTAICLRAVKSKLLSSFLVMQGILALWIFSKILKTFAPNAAAKFFFVVCQYAGVCFLGPAFIVFAHIFAFGAVPGKKLMAPLTAVSVLCFLSVATNPLHHLFYSHFDFWGDSFGPLFYFHQGFSYLLFLIGGAICGKAFFGRMGEKRIQTLLLAVAIAIPIIANILYVSRLFRKIFGFLPPFDITPMSASAALIIFALATFRFNFFYSLKIARRAALSNIPEGILLMAGGRISGFNETFAKIAAGGELAAADGKSVITVLGNDGRLHKLRRLRLAFDPGRPQDFIYQTVTGRRIRVICRPVTSNSFSGAFIRFVDVTAKQVILEKLQAKNEELLLANRQLTLQAELRKKLVVARTRNFMAQEAHDILGHSIMLAISLLELARMSETEPQESEYIHKAKKVLSGCLDEICALTSAEDQSPIAGQGIEERLKSLADDFRSASIDVGIHCSNLKQEIGARVQEAVFRLCREGITNALRHGKASRLDIILRSRNDMAELFIIDNGLGSKNVQKGMGLSGMERRVSMLNGEFRCHSFDGQGFCVQASIPLQRSI